MRLPRASLVLLLCAPHAAALPQVVPPAPARDAPRADGLDPAHLPRAAPGRFAEWDPHTPPNEAALADLRAALVLQARGEHLAALRRFFAVLRSEPDYPPALYQAGVACFRLRRYGDAALLLERYLEAVPERVGDTRALAHCYYTLGRHAEARAHYERVLAARPDGDVEARFGYALCHLRLGEEERALELLDEVLRLAPDHAEAHLWVAQVRHERGELEAALAATDRVLELAPFQARVWFLRARVLYESGRDEEAQLARQRFAELDRVEQAVRALEGRLETDPRQGEVHARLVELWRSVGHVQAVRAALRRWMLLEPRDVALAIHALDVLEALGDLQGGGAVAEDLQRLAAGAGDVEAWRRLARWFALTRQRVRQIEAEDQVRRLTHAGG